MNEPANILLVSGSLRQGSTNTALLRTAAVVAPAGITAELYGGMGELPHFNPDLDTPPLDPAVDGLRTAIRRSDALALLHARVRRGPARVVQESARLDDRRRRSRLHLREAGRLRQHISRPHGSG